MHRDALQIPRSAGLTGDGVGTHATRVLADLERPDRRRAQGVPEPVSAEAPELVEREVVEREQGVTVAAATPPQGECGQLRWVMERLLEQVQTLADREARDAERLDLPFGHRRRDDRGVAARPRRRQHLLDVAPDRAGVDPEDHMCDLGVTAPRAQVQRAPRPCGLAAEVVVGRHVAERTGTTAGSADGGSLRRAWVPTSAPAAGRR